MVRPPDAEPVSAERMLVASASETSGPPPMPSTQSRTIANAGIAATTAPKPTRLATLTTGRTDALAPASTVLRNSVRRLRLSTHQCGDGQDERHEHRPYAAHRRHRCAAPALVVEETQVETRQHDERDHQVDHDHHDQRQRGDKDAGRGGACVPWPISAGSKAAGGGRALAKRRIVAALRRRRRPQRRSPRPPGAPIFPRAPATTARRPA